MTETLTFMARPTPKKDDAPNATRIIRDTNGYMLALFPRKDIDGHYDPTGGPITMYKNGNPECSATRQQYAAIVSKLDGALSKRVESRNVTHYEVEPGLLSNFCKKQPRPELDL